MSISDLHTCKIRLATTDDLKELREVYLKIVDDIKSKGIKMWSEDYPVGLFPEDIAQGRLYVLTTCDGVILGAFAIYDEHRGELAVKWQDMEANAVYLHRFGINVDFSKKGLGTQLLGSAMLVAKQRGADYLRFFVVEDNKPAIRFYEKNGFLKAGGMFIDEVTPELVFHEYGYEKQV